MSKVTAIKIARISSGKQSDEKPNALVEIVRYIYSRPMLESPDDTRAHAEALCFRSVPVES